LREIAKNRQRRGEVREIPGSCQRVERRGASFAPYGGRKLDMVAPG
jgi:hypothetical protein